MQTFLAKLNRLQSLRMRSTNQDWRSSKRLSCLNMRMMGKCLQIVLIRYVVFHLFILRMCGVDYEDSVLSVWMIISPRMIFVLCRVVMLSIKLAWISGYRLGGIIVLLVEQWYVQKNNCFTLYICLMIDSFSSRA